MSHTYDKTLKEWVNVLRGDPCSYCGAVNEDIDHIEPRQRWARRGHPVVGELAPDFHSEFNLTSSCGHCNGKKGSRPLLYFLLARLGAVNPPGKSSSRESDTLIPVTVFLPTSEIARLNRDAEEAGRGGLSAEVRYVLGKLRRDGVPAGNR